MQVEAVRFQSRKRGWFLGMLGVMLACLTGTVPKASHAQAVGEVRYVWVDTMPLRLAPDGKEVVRLPYGTKVVLLPDSAALVPHREIMFGLYASGDQPEADVVLEGYWRRAQALGKEGWVFDGYLSRYAAPGTPSKPSAHGDDEIAYAAEVFGVAHAWRWKNGDQKKGEPYRIMRRKWKLNDNPDANRIYWTRVEFKHGGAAERSRIMGNGATENLALEGMPLTFNEALLWWRHFRFFYGSGTFDAGHRLQVDNRDCGQDSHALVTCGKETCDIVSDAVN